MKIMALNIGSLPDWIYGFERFSVGVIGLGFGLCLVAFSLILFGIVFEMMSAKIKEVIK